MPNVLATKRKNGQKIITPKTPDVIIFEDYEIVEDDVRMDESTKRHKGRMIVRGIFQKADTKNGNGRIYPSSLWERLLSDPDLIEMINSRGMLGELEHPEDGETNLNRVSHIVTSLERIGDDIIGTSEILNTPRGLVLQELFRSRARVGISSRGKGTSTYRGDAEYVNEDYGLQTFDYVYNPSTTDAFPEVVSESQNSDKKNTEEELVVRLQDLQIIEGRVSDISRLLPNASPADYVRFAEGLTRMQIDVSKAMEEDSSLTGFGQEILSSISEAKKSVKGAQAGTLQEGKELATKARNPVKSEGDFPPGDDDDEPDMEPDDGDTECYEQLAADLTCESCGNTQLMKVDSTKKLGEAYKAECQNCGTRMSTEAVYRIRKDEGMTCPNHQDKAMDLSLKEGVYSCSEDGCDHTEKMVEAMTKGELVARLRGVMGVASTIAERNGVLEKSNRVLQQRLGSAVKLIGETVTKAENSAVAAYVTSAINKYNGLSKVESVLRSCRTVAEAQEKVKELTPLLQNESRTRTRKGRPTRKRKVEGLPTKPSDKQKLVESQGKRASKLKKAAKPTMSEAVAPDVDHEDYGVSLLERMRKRNPNLK